MGEYVLLFDVEAGAVMHEVVELRLNIKDVHIVKLVSVFLIINLYLAAFKFI